MDVTQIVLTVVGSVIGSGAVFGFVQFLITRRDKRQEEAKHDHDEELKQEMKDHLTNVNAQWKVDYCDKNAKAINNLVEEVRIGLADREAMGKKRYDEHHIAIEKLSIQHQKEFLELKKAIDKLTENDTRITSSLEKMSEKQGNMADGLLGLAHDRIIFSTDKIAERGAVTLREKATLKSMYEPYRKLGGNGDCETAMEHVMNLPVVSDEKAKQKDIENKKRQE